MDILDTKGEAMIVVCMLIANVAHPQNLFSTKNKHHVTLGCHQRWTLLWPSLGYNAKWPLSQRALDKERESKERKRNARRPLCQGRRFHGYTFLE